jgi:hypothetical protein
VLTQRQFFRFRSSRTFSPIVVITGFIPARHPPKAADKKRVMSLISTTWPASVSLNSHACYQPVSVDVADQEYLSSNMRSGHAQGTCWSLISMQLDVSRLCSDYIVRMRHGTEFRLGWTYIYETHTGGPRARRQEYCERPTRATPDAASWLGPYISYRADVEPVSL